MPKPRAFLHKKNKGKKEEPSVETADDYQAAGVDFEEAAGKHRAGDAIKSLRFFERAINTYDEGLAKFPTSFDLAYNKARVQYEVATHPKLAEQLQQPLLDLLRVALASHERALKLDEHDADLLFNTSQVLTSLAEELANEGSTEEAIGLLQSAQNLQARCLSIQEEKYAETLEQEREAREIFEAPPDEECPAGEMQQDDHADANSAMPKEEGQWASILEPVTADTLVDTTVACFETMTTLCTTISTSREVLWQGPITGVESQYESLLNRIQGLKVNNPEKMHEFSLADAILQSAMLDVSFTFNDVLPAMTYKSLLEDVWNIPKPHLDLETSVDALIAHANALIAFNFSLSTKQDDPDAGLLANFRWTALASASKSLTTASRINSVSQEDKAKTHLLRGDVSLLQYRLSAGSLTHKQASANAETLLKNAEVFYRNAAQLSGHKEEKERALFRCTIVQQLGGQGANDAEVPALNDQERRAAEQLQEMIDEGLVVEGTDPIPRLADLIGLRRWK